MTKTLHEILNLLSSMCDKEVTQTKDFGIEFGTYAEKITKATTIKSIFVSTCTNFKLIHAMNENKSNLAITIFPLSIIESGFPLSERDFEMMRSLMTNNIKTISLSKNWLYSQNGAFGYFLQTLGINQYKHSKESVSQGINIYRWDIETISFKDFLASLSHLTKRWSAFYKTSENQPISLVLENQQVSGEELAQLKKEGVTTVVGFNLNSQRLNAYQENKMNFLFIPIQDYCNIALRKFSQLLQMKVDQKVIFQPQDVVGWISVEDLTN
ncbi:MAG: hypothetical protein KGD64_06645 [Candidatus Heimdallarchaeota archaeon]|nr:hypothetical protein [Candidatus Heimdallarchaeota archaeon]